MLFDEENKVTMTGGSRNRKRSVVPPPAPDPWVPSHRRKQSGIAASILIGMLMTAFLVCAAAVLLARAGTSLPSSGFRFSVPTAGIRNELIQEAVEGYLLSAKNAMRSLNASSNYHIKRSAKDQGIVLVTIAVTQETENTYYECDLQTKWKGQVRLEALLSNQELYRSPVVQGGSSPSLLDGGTDWKCGDPPRIGKYIFKAIKKVMP